MPEVQSHNTTALDRKRSNTIAVGVAMANLMDAKTELEKCLIARFGQNRVTDAVESMDFGISVTWDCIDIYFARR